MIKALLCMLRSMDLNRTLIGFILIGGSAISDGTAITAPPEQAQNDAIQTINIKIQNFKFIPAMVSVKSSTRVAWTYLDEVVHSVVLGTPSNYHYHCGIHSFMQGTIRVIAASSGDSSVAQP